MSKEEELKEEIEEKWTKCYAYQGFKKSLHGAIKESFEEGKAEAISIFNEFEFSSENGMTFWKKKGEISYSRDIIKLIEELKSKLAGEELKDEK